MTIQIPSALWRSAVALGFILLTNPALPADEHDAMHHAMPMPAEAGDTEVTEPSELPKAASSSSTDHSMHADHQSAPEPTEDEDDAHQHPVSGDTTAQERDHAGMQTGSMAMQMQGGAAPANARDPHAYSGGYALDSGPYALAGERQLRLADEHHFWSFVADRLESQNSDSPRQSVYDVQAWYGSTYDKLTLKSEGGVLNGRVSEGSTDLLWSHAVSPFWDTQLGARLDQGQGGPNRTWLAFGIQGLAPYWFEVEATAYIGSGGRTALTLQTEYDLLLTQRLILQPRVEVNFYGKQDTAAAIGSGLSDGAVGLRLRYEFGRKLAPYVGVEWDSKFGTSADMARASGEDATETRFVAGVRLWF